MKSVVLCLVLLAGAAFDVRAEPDPGGIFTRKCSSCHTYGKGDLVGPDLKGVTDRHSRQWLTTWISSSENAIASGDPAAAALFRKYKQQRMPEQKFSPSELAALLDYLAAGDPRPTPAEGIGGQTAQRPRRSTWDDRSSWGGGRWRVEARRAARAIACGRPPEPEEVSVPT
jgi:hypothetical protein